MSTLKGEQTWFVEAHQFRIDTLHGIGRPTPEGAHRDGGILWQFYWWDANRLAGAKVVFLKRRDAAVAGRP